MLLAILMVKKFMWHRMFYVTEMEKANQKHFRAEKLIKSKGGKLYVKRKGYDHSFNSWVDNKDVAIQNDLFPEPYKKN